MRASDLPRRAARRVHRAVRPAAELAPPPARQPEPVDDLLALQRERLDALEAEAEAAGTLALDRLRDLPDDLFGLLVAGGQTTFPALAAALPRAPEPGMQELFNGLSGLALGVQSHSFVEVVRRRAEEHGTVPLAQARVLDLGCGWGRLLRWFAREVAPGALHGCDPSEGALELCRTHGVPAVLARSAYLPDQLPFAEPFDLAYAFSVFTHTSERSTLACLKALHGALKPGGLLVATVRPPAYLGLSPHFAAVAATLEPGWEQTPRHLFAPHPTDGHFQHDGGEMHYGEAITTLAAVRTAWRPWFELLAVDPQLADPYQLVLTLRRGEG